MPSVLLSPIEVSVDPALAETFLCEAEVIQPALVMLITPGGETYLPDQPPTVLVTVGKPNPVGESPSAVTVTFLID